MSRDTTLIYDGKLKAVAHDHFMRLGQQFILIKPGYDSQSRRRLGWTQVVWNGIPIWEWRLDSTPEFARNKFEESLRKYVGRNKERFLKALELTHKKRKAVFMDGAAGQPIAPTMKDPRNEALHYDS